MDFQTFRTRIHKPCIESLKGQSNDIFYLHFFHYSNLPGLLTTVTSDQWVKIFLILVKISWSYSNFRLNKLTRGGGSHVLADFLLTPRGMILRGDGLLGVSYPGESCFGGFFIDSPGFDTPGRLTRRGIIPRGD